MTINTKKNSARYGLIVVLILALFISAIFFYTRNNRLSILSANVNQLTYLESDYSSLDTCILLLYKADNNCRLFEVTGQASYMKQFNKGIARVSGILDTLKINQSSAQNSQNIKGLVEQKRVKMQTYLMLRKLTDSLFHINAEIDTIKDREVADVAGYVTRKRKSTVVIDTIKPTEQTKERNLLGRIADAFAKQKKKKRESTLVKKEITQDSSLTKTDFTKDEIRAISNYYRKLYAANKRLKDNEIEILRINSRIINEIVFLLQNYKKKDAAFLAETKKNIHFDLDDTFKSINNIYIVIFILLMILVAVILFNLWKIYRNEGKLIDYGHKASQYAQSKSRFLANMSHEIRTPLNSVIGFSEQLSQDNLSVQQKEQVDAIKTSSELLLDLVNDILDFSKYEDGKITFDKVNFAPADAINEVVSSVAVLASKKGITLNKELSFSSNFCLSGDSLRLKQVIMNLLSNAIKFTDAGSVTLKADVVSTSKKKVNLKIQVIDTGIGIEDKDAAVIFDEFSQVNYSATKNTHKGTGLGLAICKKIVELQNGKIGLVSKINEGSTFSFEIPYELCESQNNKEKSLATSNVSHLEGKRVLLVDDNKMNVLLAQTVLRKYNIVTESAYDGAAAYQLFENNSYDLVLTDVQMPVMGGVELTRLIKADKDKKKAAVPVLGVTANVIEEDRDRYLAAGMDGLVLKPYSEKELIDKIAGVIK
jgi:signal transduction histidine kinase